MDIYSIFLDNKYTRWYGALIAKAISRNIVEGYCAEGKDHFRIAKIKSQHCRKESQI